MKSTVKKATAMMMASMMLISPMTASAATWGQVVGAIRQAQSSGNTAAADDVTVSYDGARTTITGGKITPGADTSMILPIFVMGDTLKTAGAFLGGSVKDMLDAYHLEEGSYIIESDVEGIVLIGNLDDDRLDVELRGKILSASRDGEERLPSGVMMITGGDTTVKLKDDVDLLAAAALKEGSGTLETDGAVRRLLGAAFIGDQAQIAIQGEGTIEQDAIVGAIAAESVLDIFKKHNTVDLTKMQTICKENLHLDADLFGKQPGDTITILTVLMDSEEGIRFEPITVVLEDLTPEEPFNLYETEAYKEAMEEHAKEEERKAGAIGGVYGSPYWVKQLSLGYNSYNLRVYMDGEQVNFKESLSWRETGKNSSKTLGLRVNTKGDELGKLSVHLDEAVIAVLEQAEISLITLNDKDGENVMSYEVSDIRAAYEQYGLDGSDLLVLGGYDDEVMMIGSDGVMKPVEEAAK